MSWLSDILPGGSKDPFTQAVSHVFGSGAVSSAKKSLKPVFGAPPTANSSFLYNKFGDDLFKSVDPSRAAGHVLGDTAAAAFDPSNIFKSAKTALDDPKATLRYIDDARQNPNWQDAPSWMTGQIPNLIARDLSRGQAQADAANPDWGALTDQDLYRTASEQSAPRDDPFAAQNYNDDFMTQYGARNRPRVYASEGSFVFPDTPASHPNTALLPATGERVNVAGGGSTTPLATGPIFAPEVTAQTATPGYTGQPNRDTVASQFKIPDPTKQKKLSTKVVR